MIFSTQKKILILSPEKTGTKARFIYFHKYNDINQLNQARSREDIYYRPKLGWHSTLSKCIEYSEKFDLDLSDYHKYCFVRNPWDRVCSMFHMFNKYKPINLRKHHFKPFVTNYAMGTMDKYYMHNNQFSITKVYKFEELKESISQINAKHKLCLSDFEVNSSHYDWDYKSWITSELNDIIYKKEEKTINLFNYKLS